MILKVNDDSKGTKKFLSEWKGDIKKTFEGKETLE